ncbi:hypothetical protein PACID_19710 [Acidipropionibacterium acidipropionici ATCC 4875]|uniref:Uncharacterized protein n=1 Tax=Acidipropionibacterium acidipropionici (strain ATCC 4875 / DSM 20272 / JCM 6432 / NBRC 12425 / NCIMB 8070 / 4) TaxID=1171373 RepID=K7SKH6_ACIA4|nr:hypothetical protein PACID_19710 [Acidipropionibacterium acidipropionici ATCC 4875]
MHMGHAPKPARPRRRGLHCPAGDVSRPPRRGSSAPNGRVGRDALESTTGSTVGRAGPP